MEEINKNEVVEYQKQNTLLTEDDKSIENEDIIPFNCLGVDYIVGQNHSNERRYSAD